MNGFATKLLLPLAMLGTLAAPLAAQGPTPGGMAQMQHTAAAPGPQRPMSPAAMPGLGLAAHLAGAGIWLGITDAQQDVWHDYCQALIGFVTPDMPSPDAAPDPAARPLPAEMMATRALARADKAQALLDATSALREALEPAQIDRLAQIEPMFGPGPRAPHPGGQHPRAPHGPDMRR